MRRDTDLSTKLEMWRRALIEMKQLGIEATVELSTAGVTVRARDDDREHEHTFAALAADYDPGDRVLTELMKTVDTFLTKPAFTVIKGGKAQQA